MADALKQAGNKHFGAKEYAKAVKKYTEALTKTPSDDDAAVILANRSASYTLLNKYDLGKRSHSSRRAKRRLLTRTPPRSRRRRPARRRTPSALAESPSPPRRGPLAQTRLLPSRGSLETRDRVLGERRRQEAVRRLDGASRASGRKVAREEQAGSKRPADARLARGLLVRSPHARGGTRSADALGGRTLALVLCVGGVRTLVGSDRQGRPDDAQLAGQDGTLPRLHPLRDRRRHPERPVRVPHHLDSRGRTVAPRKVDAHLASRVDVRRICQVPQRQVERRQDHCRPRQANRRKGTPQVRLVSFALSRLAFLVLFVSPVPG